ncbi:hypothetical protein KKE34_02750 [Patescibacteria group bacterium]|nr:hypothetical protein [Patescibacteria group bacterium]MBU1885508.1 hypothetical protein [Patescibacteria group bacterium]
MSKLLNQLTSLPYFTAQAVMQLSDNTPKSVLVMLSRLVKQNKIIRLKKGYYQTYEFYLIHHRELYFKNLISNIIQPYSYLSKEYVLQQNQVLTEVTHPVTAVTSKNTQSINNPIAIFDYFHLQENLYDGYKITYHHNIACAKANISKALFDYLYFRSVPDLLLKTSSLIEELRLNLENFTVLDWKLFEKYVIQADSKKMSAILNNIKKHLYPKGTGEKYYSGA